MELHAGTPPKLVLSPSELDMLLAGREMPRAEHERPADKVTPLVADQAKHLGDRLAAKKMRVQGRGEIGPGDTGPNIVIARGWRNAAALTLAAWAIRFGNHARKEARTSGNWETARRARLLVNELTPLVLLTGDECIGLIDVESLPGDTAPVEATPIETGGVAEPPAELKDTLAANELLMAEIMGSGGTAPPGSS